MHSCACLHGCRWLNVQNSLFSSSCRKRCSKGERACCDGQAVCECGSDYRAPSRFTVKENVSSSSQAKNSVTRTIRAKLIEQMPNIEIILDTIMPKKSQVYILKWSPFTPNPHTNLHTTINSYTSLHTTTVQLHNSTLQTHSLTFSMFALNSSDNITMVAAENRVLFFQVRDGPFFPTLRLLHQCQF